LRFRRGYFDLSINKEKKVVDTCESCVGTWGAPLHLCGASRLPKNTF
jgi:hypothetical protein